MGQSGTKRLKPDDRRNYSCELTVDMNTVNRELKLSNNNRKVTCVWWDQQYPDHPDRFDNTYCSQLLCSNALTGRSYWEVQWRGQVEISVSYRGIRRKGDSWFGGNDQSWCLLCTDDGYTFCHNNIDTPISSPVSNRVAVYVDCPAGSLSFYTVSFSLMHIYTFHTTFTEPLYAGFGLLPGASVSLIDL